MENKGEKACKSNNPGSSCDFELIRQDFPAIENLGAYLDTAYVGLMPYSVRAAHEAFLEERGRFGPFPIDKTILRVWLQKLEEVRVKLASFLGAQEREIAFAYCTGCGANIALNGIDWRTGDNAVVDDLEYPTDVHILNALRARGIDIRIAKSEHGAIPPNKFEALVDERTRALVVSHISYLNGFRHNLSALAEIIHRRGGYLVVDGTQSIGTIKVDIEKEGVDFFTGATYKWLLGPTGVGFFYIRKDLLPYFSPDRLGWSSTENYTLLETMESAPLPVHARRFEYGTLNFEGIYALAAALDYITGIGIEVIEQHNLALVNTLRERLREKNVRFYTPENNLAPILTFFIDDEKAFGEMMRRENVFVTARRWKEGQVRISPHIYNNEEDIEVFMNAYSRVFEK